MIFYLLTREEAETVEEMAPDDLGHGVQVEGGEVGGDHHARQAHDNTHLPTVHAHSYRERGAWNKWSCKLYLEGKVQLRHFYKKQII